MNHEFDVSSVQGTGRGTLDCGHLRRLRAIAHVAAELDFNYAHRAAESSDPRKCPPRMLPLRVCTISWSSVAQARPYGWLATEVNLTSQDTLINGDITFCWKRNNLPHSLIANCSLGRRVGRERQRCERKKD